MTTAHRLNQAMAKVVTEAIRSNQMTQREVSAAAGVPLVTLNRKLNGSSSFNVIELAAVAAALGISLTDLALRAERESMASAAA